MVRFFLILLVFLSVQTIFSQSVNKLTNQLYGSAENRLMAAIKLVDIYTDTNPDSLFSIGQYLVNTGLDSENEALTVYGKLILAGIYTTNGKTEQSLAFLKECENYYTKKQDLEKLASTQNKIGINYVYKTEYKIAANWFVKSIKTAEKLGEDNQSYMGQLNLCEVYIRQGKLNLAEAEMMSFLQKVKSQKLENGQRKAYNYLTKIYLQKGDLSLATKYAVKALNLALMNNDVSGRANAYTNIAIVYFETNEPNLALENFKKALAVRLKLNQPKGISESYYNIGDWYFYTEDLKSALVYYHKSLEIAEISDLLNEKADAYDRIAATYKSMRNFEKAEEYLSKYIEAYKLIQKNNQQKETDFLEVAYELDRQEAIRLQAKRENKLQNKVVREQNRGKLIVIAFLVILGGILVWELFKVVRERNLKHKESSSFLVQQAAPHMLEIASQWNRMEELLANKKTSINQELPWKATHRMREIKIHSNLYLIIETNASPLEEFVLCDFLKDNIHESMDETTIHKLISSQNLIDVDQVSFGFIQISDEVVSVMGDHLLISQGEGEVLFPSSTYKKLNRFDVVITDRLRNYLIEKNSWEMWVEQLKQIRNMSSSMAFQTLEDAWILDFNEGKFGLIFKT